MLGWFMFRRFDYRLLWLFICRYLLLVMRFVGFDCLIYLILVLLGWLFDLFIFALFEVLLCVLFCMFD